MLKPRGHGILDRPPSRAMTTEGTKPRIPAARFARGCVSFRPSSMSRGRREDRVRAAPAVSCANCTKESAHEHTGSAEAIRPSLRNGFTAYFELSPVTGFLATVTSQDLICELGASTGAPGPHDFAVRVTRARLSRALASTASHRNVRDDREPPLIRVRRGSCSVDLPDGESGVFLRERLDRLRASNVELICPTGSIHRAVFLLPLGEKVARSAG